MAHSSEVDIDQRIVKAMGHPLRLRLLAELSERVASPSELAEKLGEPLGNVSYHVRLLADLGCLELVGTTPRRGAVEHHYRAVVRPFFSDHDWSKLPIPARQAISDTVVAQIWRDTAAALEAGSFDARDDRHLSSTNLVLDAKGWEELTSLLADALDRALEIHAQSAERLQRGGNGEAPPTSKLVMMHFPAAPAPSGKKPSPRTKRRP